MDAETTSFEHLDARRNRSRSNLLVCFIVLAFAAGLGTGCENRVASVRPPETPAVEVKPVIEKDVPIQGEWVGTLEGGRKSLDQA